MNPGKNSARYVHAFASRPFRSVELQLMRAWLATLMLCAWSALPAAAQEMMPATSSGWTAWAPRAESAPARQVTQTSSGYTLHIYGNQVPHVYGGWRARLQGLQGGAYYRFRARAVPLDIASLRESITIVLRWRGSFGDEVPPDYVWDYRLQTDGSLLFDRVIQAPTGTTAVDVDLVLQWSPGGRVAFDGLSFTPATAPAPRPVRVAAVHYRPSGSASGLESVQKAAQYADQVAAAQRPDVMVLGELLNVIGAPGTYDSKAETVPGPSTDVLAGVARANSVYIAFGILERSGSLLYNSAVLLDRSGSIVGKYRKVQLPLSEASAGIGPGTNVPVFQTEIGRLALLICQDTSFPEPAREAALQGAELLLVPIWGGKTSLVRARAAEHGVYLAASGYDYASEVVGPLGTVLAGVSTISSPGAAVANIDLSRRFRETWLGEMRDLSNKERRSSPYQRKIDEPPTTEPPPPPPPGDTSPPVVSLTAPASGATLSGVVSVAATASDNVGVVRVRFSVDGTPLGADDTTAPYSVSWDTRTAANGSHTITATAYDAAGHDASSSATVTVSNATVTGRPIPGTIQAEDYDAGGEGVGYHDTTAVNSGGQYRNDGVDIEVTADTGGGYNVGWVAATEWLKYTVSVQAAGTYTLRARVAANGTGGTFHVEVGGTNVTGPLSIPNTGGWQAWRDVTATVTLAAGVQPMRVVFDSAGPTGVVGNINYVSFATGTVPVPAQTIQAESYDAGGEGVGYHDTTAGNTGGQYRTDGVDIEVTTDTGGGYNVGWIAATEWLKYTVSVPAAGSSTLRARVAANGAGGTFHVEVGGVNVTGPLTIPNTGGWQAWRDVTATVTLAAGSQPMRVVFDSAGPTGVVGNLNYIRLEPQ